MELRPYKKEDADIICTWIRNEEELYKWSADRMGVFPLTAEVIDSNYASSLAGGRFYPLTAVDEEGRVVGNFIIRYPAPDNDKSVRFGFVIVDPDIRGKGNGRKMLELGIQYAKEVLKAERIDLGVFANNVSAKRCYESVGFTKFGEHIWEMPLGTWVCEDLVLFI